MMGKRHRYTSELKAEAVHVRVEVFNVLGQQVAVLADEDYLAGRHLVRWYGTDQNGQTVPSGLYLYRIVAGDLLDTRKMILLK